jgi:threonine/homoserine/homoserine lactone efflux protein
MFDARYFAFAAISAVLVVSPGATLAVVVETALGYGRRAALLTVAGVGLGNAALASAAAFGLAGLVGRWPSSLATIRLAGGIYLAYLGVRGMWRALSPPRRMAETEMGPVPFMGTGPISFVARGALTNLLNPPVLLFYATMVPQFIGPQDPYLARALVLGATHVAMSIFWQGSCGLAVGIAAEHMRRPAVRRALEGLTGGILVVLAARLLM